MDWVHCNVCFFQPGQLPRRNFNLTSCGHIFCQFCEISGTIEKCKICGVKCTTTPLNSQMSKELRVYFDEPENTLLNMQEKVIKALEFQRSHRQRFNENYRNVVEKYQKLKITYQRMAEESKSSLRRLEEENKALRRELEASQNSQEVNTPPQPPPMNRQHPLFSRNSVVSRIIENNSRGAQRGGTTSPFFTPPLVPGHASQQYRNPAISPSTPLSDTSSNSPLSVASSCHTRGSHPEMSSSQRSYRPGLTPPFNCLRMLSVQPRNNSNQY